MGRTLVRRTAVCCHLVCSTAHRRIKKMCIVSFPELPLVKPAVPASPFPRGCTLPADTRHHDPYLRPLAAVAVTDLCCAGPHLFRARRIHLGATFRGPTITRRRWCPNRRCALLQRGRPPARPLADQEADNQVVGGLIPEVGQPLSC
jgi:hypothetical protein